MNSSQDDIKLKIVPGRNIYYLYKMRNIKCGCVIIKNLKTYLFSALVFSLSSHALIRAILFSVSSRERMTSNNKY